MTHPFRPTSRPCQLSFPQRPFKDGSSLEAKKKEARILRACDSHFQTGRGKLLWAKLAGRPKDRTGLSHHLPRQLLLGSPQCWKCPSLGRSILPLFQPLQLGLPSHAANHMLRNTERQDQGQSSEQGAASGGPWSIRRYSQHQTLTVKGQPDTFPGGPVVIPRHPLTSQMAKSSA